ncbi:histidinol-phosphate aminotransferase [Acidimicrobium ferrooxidans DSM 10331]|uniref:Histidinol-phosphate aminotransferase n=1 Tax=Acidimicrobium ferrooxidans (strain DSM 10331 / JCM 15462 / NBRC 103882 / ICP) TaxID=525909 RepID=C7LZ85_ACIFD|nr:histidinol-phosphate transaminase [Acidimicrobium ferrooxidans]ACU54043.1 histidinol-phosphate aminotransferase [Acidimicrobium ferrooxidans DSM 10331]
MVRPAPSLEDALGASYHSAQVPARVRLNTNESPYGPPPAVARALEEAVALDLARYPDRRAEALRAALGRLHGVAPTSIFVANGSNEVLETVLAAWGGPGRRLWLAEPTYGMYRQIARVTRTTVVAGARRSDGSIDPSSLEADSELVIVCQPNNPTGMLEPPEVMDRVLACDDRLVLVDEAYADFADLGPATLLGDHVVRIRTLSKAAGLAGLRLGYAVCAPEVADVLWSACLPYHVNAVTQAVAVAALADVDEIARRAALVVRERERVGQALGTLAARVWPSATNFILFDPGRPATEVWEGLVAKGILIRDASRWPGLSNTLRVTIGTADENDAFLAALGEVLA